jgi:peptidoglycan/xylan/chitin deacetylase (PgdA/CDA1 family)
MPFTLRARRIPILYYHEVGPTRAKHVVHPDDFAAQLDWLADAGYTPLSIDALCDVLEGAAPEPQRPVVLTFDDGRAGVLRHAAPALGRRGFPATLYAVSDWLEGRGIPNVERYSDFLGWSDLTTLRGNGFTIGSHTLSHRTLKQLPAAEQVREVVESRSRIEQGLGVPVCHFSFPKGRSTRTARRSARAAGYRSAVATGERCVGRLARLHDLGRLRVDGREDLVAYRHRVEGAPATP